MTNCSGGILTPWFESSCPLKGKYHCKSIQSHHLYFKMKHCYAAESSFFQDDNTLIHRACMVC